MIWLKQVRGTWSATGGAKPDVIEHQRHFDLCTPKCLVGESATFVPDARHISRARCGELGLRITMRALLKIVTDVMWSAGT